VYYLLIFALAGMLLFSECARADDTTLPSRKPDVVLPLLKQFSETDGLAKITHILGKEDFDTAGSFLNPEFKLTDGTTIEVKATLQGRVYYIGHRINFGADGTQIIYQRNKASK